MNALPNLVRMKWSGRATELLTARFRTPSDDQCAVRRAVVIGGVAFEGVMLR